MKSYRLLYNLFESYDNNKISLLIQLCSSVDTPCYRQMKNVHDFQTLFKSASVAQCVSIMCIFRMAQY